MSVDFIIGLIIGNLLFIFLDFISCEPIRNKYRKDCKYDCSNCNVWDCQKKVCDYKKKLLNKKESLK